MKGPYNKEETEFLQSLVYGGLKRLADTRDTIDINYEECCILIATNIPESIIAPEFSGYWNYWATQFASKKGRKTREKIFYDLIVDLENKGLLPANLAGLTGNFSTRINEIINNPNL